MAEIEFLERINKRRKSAVAIFHEFRLKSHHDKAIHLFCEGYDDIGFFGRHTTTYAEEKGWKVIEYMCYGKDNISEITKMYESLLEPPPALMVRDGDFDVFLSNIETRGSIFITPGFSIENIVCSPENISALLRTVFGVDHTEVDIEGIKSRYKSEISNIFGYMAEFYGACICALRQNRKLDLDKINIKKIASSAGDGDAKLIFTDAELKSVGLTPDDFNPTSREVGTLYVKQCAMKWTRGKYIVTFAKEFLIKLIEEFRELLKSGLIKRFRRAAMPDISETSLLERLCAISPAPRSFFEMLEKLPLGG